MKSAKQQSALAIGSNIYLRPVTAADRDEFTDLNRKSLRLYRGLTAPISTAEQFANYLGRCRRDDFEGLLVCLKDDHVIVGSINLSQIFRGVFQNAYLGYQVGAPYAGRGYMSEALPLVLEYAFQKLKLHRLEANIQPHNAASIALVTRAGFTKEGYSRKYLKIGGRWRDHERWAMLAENWRSRVERRLTKQLAEKAINK
jgi:ribosomal-protein-alanine N-acetyltransferase